MVAVVVLGGMETVGKTGNPLCDKDFSMLNFLKGVEWTTGKEMEKNVENPQIFQSKLKTSFQNRIFFRFSILGDVYGKSWVWKT